MFVTNIGTTQANWLDIMDEIMASSISAKSNQALSKRMKSWRLPSPPSPTKPLLPAKQRRLKPPSPSPSPSPPPSTPPPSSPSPSPSPLHPKKDNPTTTRTRKSLIPSLSTTTTTTTTPVGWEPLHVTRSELCLPLTLPTGQTFRWKQTAPDHFTGVVGPHLLSLKHADSDGHVIFLLHHSPAATAAARSALREYLNLDVSLAELWRGFAESDARFAELARCLPGGARVLRQDPVECVFQFLCSSNNNIKRIERMVGVLSSFGDYLGTVGGVDFHRFPSIERLALVSEQHLREAGFGYRAKYIIGAAKALQAKPGGGAEWLALLRGLELPEVIDALCTLPGVGPKVAACIALFSLDQHHAVPVDTHVWQIATRYLLPELAGSHLTPKLFGRVSEAFVTKFGKYAGWAQTVLFIGELPSQRALLLSRLCSTKETKLAKRKREKGSLAVDMSLET